MDFFLNTSSGHQRQTEASCNKKLQGGWFLASYPIVAMQAKALALAKRNGSRAFTEFLRALMLCPHCQGGQPEVDILGLCPVLWARGGSSGKQADYVSKSTRLWIFFEYLFWPSEANWGKLQQHLQGGWFLASGPTILMIANLLALLMKMQNKYVSKGAWVPEIPYALVSSTTKKGSKIANHIQKTLQAICAHILL